MPLSCRADDHVLFYLPRGTPPQSIHWEETRCLTVNKPLFLVLNIVFSVYLVATAPHSFLSPLATGLHLLVIFDVGHDVIRNVTHDCFAEPR